MNRPRIAVMGTFDTKADEYQYIIDRIGQLGADVLTIDVSTRDTAVLRGEYGCREIAQYAGSTYELLTSGTRAESMAIIMEGATKLVRQLLQEGRIQGLVSIGGSGGTTLATHVMRAADRLPEGHCHDAGMQRQAARLHQRQGHHRHQLRGRRVRSELHHFARL